MRWTEKDLIQRLEQAMVDKVPIEKENTSEVANATVFITRYLLEIHQSRR